MALSVFGGRGEWKILSKNMITLIFVWVLLLARAWGSAFGLPSSMWRCLEVLMSFSFPSGSPGPHAWVTWKNTGSGKPCPRWGTCLGHRHRLSLAPQVPGEKGKCSKATSNANMVLNNRCEFESYLFLTNCPNVGESLTPSKVQIPQ